MILPDGTTYYGDELRPLNGTAGGGIYKFVPTTLHDGGPISSLTESPYVAGSVYVLRLVNDDVWACLPDGEDTDTLSDGCVRVMTLKDGEAEFTGIEFLADGEKFLIHVQHRTQEAGQYRTQRMSYSSRVSRSESDRRKTR